MVEPGGGGGGGGEEEEEAELPPPTQISSSDDSYIKIQSIPGPYICSRSNCCARAVPFSL